MKTNKWIVGVIVLMMAGIANISLAQENLMKDWTQLGTRVVDFTLDHDVVNLTNSKDPFTSLRVTVKNGSLNMHKATVHFVNGDKQDVTFPDVVTSENSGQTIDLKGNDRVIEKVTFWYDTKNSSNQKATIEVWGKKS